MTYTGGMMVPEQRSTAVNAATFAVSTGERRVGDSAASATRVCGSKLRGALIGGGARVGLRRKARMASAVAIQPMEMMEAPTSLQTSKNPERGRRAHGKPPAAFREKAGTPKAAKDYYLRRAGCSARMPRGRTARRDGANR